MSQSPPAPASVELHRNVGLLAAIGSGTGLIVGAGVYVLIGEVADVAGNAVWASVLLAGAVALFTGLSYAELSAMHPRAAASYLYVREAFGAGPACLIGSLAVFSQVVSVSAVALGFGSYLDDQFGFSIVAGAVLIILGSGVISYRGVKESTIIGSILSLVEIVGLAIVITAGVRFIGDQDLLELSEGASGLFTGASLMFFAFLGFEQIANFAQEIKDPGKNVPRAILFSGGIAAALYVLAAVASVSVLGWEALSASKGPLAAVAERAIGSWGSDMLFVIALVATSSTVLIALATVTRAVYGMAASGALPKGLARVGLGRRTPWVAIVAVTVVAGLIALAGDIGVVAETANFTILLVFVAVNCSLIVLRRKRPSAERPFRIPVSLFGAPVSAALGIVGSVFLMINVSLNAALYGLLVIAIGGTLYMAGRKARGARKP